MKKVFAEIGAVTFFVTLYLLVPTFRTVILYMCLIMAIWIVPVQLILSINYSNWITEICGRYSHLSFDERLGQIRSNFDGLREAESVKLRWFYLHVHIFHYLFYMVISLTIIALVIVFMYLSMHEAKPLDIALCLMAAIVVGFVGYHIVGAIYPTKERKVRDEIFTLLLSRDWRKKIDGVTTSIEVDEQLGTMSFYSFWLEGRTIEQKETAFRKFLEQLNKGSKNGQLFKIYEGDKIELVKIIDARALNKTLAGFLRFCIEDRKVLSDRVLKHTHRNLIRDVFMLGETQNLTFLETERIKTTPIEYSQVYRSAFENFAKIDVNSAV